MPENVGGGGGGGTGGRGACSLARLVLKCKKKGTEGSGGRTPCAPAGRATQKKRRGLLCSPHPLDHEALGTRNRTNACVERKGVCEYVRVGNLEERREGPRTRLAIAYLAATDGDRSIQKLTRARGSAIEIGKNSRRLLLCTPFRSARAGQQAAPFFWEERRTGPGASRSRPERSGSDFSDSVCDEQQPIGLQRETY